MKYKLSRSEVHQAIIYWLANKEKVLSHVPEGTELDISFTWWHQKKTIDSVDVEVHNAPKAR